MDEPHDAPQPHHETSDVDVRAVFAFGGGLIIVAIAIHLVIFGLFRFFSAREARQPPPQFPLAVQDENRLPPQPRLQTNPRQDLRDLRAKEDAILQSYGWIDKNNGVVRIPIQRAMELTVQRGLPARQETQQ
jgi:hypothetical protein